MPTRTQAQKEPKVKPRLDKLAVRIALAKRGWSQSDLANAIGKSLTSVNLTINHGHFVEVTELVRKELRL